MNSMDDHTNPVNPEESRVPGGPSGVSEESVYLYGDAYPKIDAKGRFSFPRQLREQLGSEKNRVVVTRGVGKKEFRHLWAFPISEWKKLIRNINSMRNSRKVDMVRQQLLGYAQDCEIDKSGRILLNQKLREFAGINTEKGDELVVTGVGHKITVWAKSTFEMYEAQLDYDAAVEEAMDDLGV